MTATQELILWIVGTGVALIYLFVATVIALVWKWDRTARLANDTTDEPNLKVVGGVSDPTKCSGPIAWNTPMRRRPGNNPNPPNGKRPAPPPNPPRTAA